MEFAGNDEEHEVQVFSEILDNAEILTNLIYLLRDIRSTDEERDRYLEIAAKKIEELGQIVRTHC